MSTDLLEERSLDGKPVYRLAREFNPISSSCKNLAKKLANVMQAVSEVPRTEQFGKDTDKIRYKFVSSNAVLDIVRQQLAAQGVAVIASAVEFHPITVTRTIRGYGNDPDRQLSDPQMIVKFVFTLVDSETGESTSSPWYGQCLNIDDKAMNKCATAAMKYWLLKTFMLSTPDEVDNDGEAGSLHSVEDLASSVGAKVESISQDYSRRTSAPPPSAPSGNVGARTNDDIPAAPREFAFAHNGKPDDWRIFYLAAKKRGLHSIEHIVESFQEAIRVMDENFQPYSNSAHAYGAIMAAAAKYDETQVPDPSKRSSQIAIEICRNYAPSVDF